jgi:dCMP deaminase
VEERHNRPEKYLWTEHAERNAIYNAVRRGVPLLGSTIYTTLFPCCECARAIVQSGIAYVVSVEPDWTDDHRKATTRFDVSRQIFEEAGVDVRFTTHGS